jgi:hypothetical protein
MKKLTPEIKKQIMRDWQSLIPQFHRFRTMGLARRVGPLVQGIEFERDSTNSTYLPTLFVHCLCRPFSVVSLSMSQPLRSIRSGGIDRISVQSHENKFQEACKRLVDSSVLAVDGDWRLSQVIEAYSRYRQRPFAEPHPIKLMEDAVSVSAWLGEIDQAKALADRYLDEARSWPDFALVQEGGFAAWREVLSSLATSSESLKKTVDEQIVSLKLEKLPESQLLS